LRFIEGPSLKALSNLNRSDDCWQGRQAQRDFKGLPAPVEAKLLLQRQKSMLQRTLGSRFREI
jgi:hypothetical protein